MGFLLSLSCDKLIKNFIKKRDKNQYMDRRNFLKVTGISLIALALPRCGSEHIEQSRYYELSPMSKEVHKVSSLTGELTKDDYTTEDALRTIVEWGQKNLFHYHDNFMPADAYGTDSIIQIMSDASIEDVFRERAVGCHLTTFVLATMLRSIGIDADYVQSGSFGPEVVSPGHGILHIPEIDKYVHGDSVCLGNVRPTERVIIDRELLFGVLKDDPLAMEEYKGNIHCGGFLKREGNSLYIGQGMIHRGFEDTELIRLQEMLPEYNPQLEELHNYGFGTGFTTDKVPIEELKF
jgi:hypothetical protein